MCFLYKGSFILELLHKANSTCSIYFREDTQAKKKKKIVHATSNADGCVPLWKSTGVIMLRWFKSAVNVSPIYMNEV